MRGILKEEKIAGIFHVLALILFGFLFCTSAVITGNNSDDIRDEYIYLERNSPLKLILILTVFLVLMFLIGKLYDKVLYKCNRNILLGIVCLISFGISIYWVMNSGTKPQADQGTVIYYAQAFSKGDFSGLQEASYMTRYLQQLGLATFHRILFYFFGDGNYMAFQIFSALMVPVLVFSGCKITRKLSGNNGKVELYYLVLTATCFPMYAYTAFVYGDLSSTTLIVLAAWILLVCLDKFSVPKLLCLAVTVGFAVQLRRNVLITLIAFGIVILVKLLQKWDWKTFLIGLSIFLGVYLFQIAIEGIYHDVKNPEAQELPAILFIALGLHDSNGRPGWNDYYEYNTFVENGDNAEAASEAARADIQKSIDRLLDDPAYILYFFQYKINTQWQSPMYQCIVMNNFVVREQSTLVRMIYEKELPGQLIKLYMKAFQFFLYGCILLWLVRGRKKGFHIENYVLLIAVFGGFLFSVIWEAKTRYIFPYMLLMLPYFGMGMQELMTFLTGLTQNIKKSFSARMQ